MEGMGPIQVSLVVVSASLIGTTVAKRPLGLQDRIAEPLLESALNPVAKTEPSLATHSPHRGQNLDIIV